jgi:glutathione S-transferase
MDPILYSFRRCPYAIRARMTLNYAGISIELREVLLKDKPPSMIEASAKGTVPVLLLPNGDVIDESYDIMRWALADNDPDCWWRQDFAKESKSLLNDNDFEFKKHLDRYKYADRFPQQPASFYRGEGERFLLQLERSLGRNKFLLDEQLTFADVAIFPFVRQFAFVDKHWFDQAEYPNLQAWLQWFLNSKLFTDVMGKYPLWRDENNDDNKPILTRD